MKLIIVIAVVACLGSLVSASPSNEAELEKIQHLLKDAIKEKDSQEKERAQSEEDELAEMMADLQGKEEQEMAEEEQADEPGEAMSQEELQALQQLLAAAQDEEVEAQDRPDDDNLEANIAQNPHDKDAGAQEGEDEDALSQDDRDDELSLAKMLMAAAQGDEDHGRAPTGKLNTANSEWIRWRRTRWKNYYNRYYARYYSNYYNRYYNRYYARRYSTYYSRYYNRYYKRYYSRRSRYYRGLYTGAKRWAMYEYSYLHHLKNYINRKSSYIRRQYNYYRRKYQ